MFGTRLHKPVENWDEYARIADWCNNNRAYIVDRDDCYEVVAVPEPTFDELKERKLEELSASFNERVSGSFRASYGYVMQFSPDDSLKMQGAIQLMDATGQDYGYLVQADNTLVKGVTVETMRAVLTEMLAAYSACHKRKQELRAMINACTTVEQLDAVRFDWPDADE